jgi:hypothetical protein
MSRIVDKSCLLSAAIAVCVAVLASPAMAGSYVVTSCSPSSSPGAWEQSNTFGDGFVAGSLCGGPAVGPSVEPPEGSHEGALYAEDILNSSAAIPDGARAGWTFRAPAGTTISAVSYYRTLHAYNDQNIVSGLFTGEGVALEQCKIPWPFVSGSSIYCDKINNQAPITFTGLSTSSLFVGVTCRIVTGALSCLGGGTMHAASADMYSARVTLSEGSLPSVGDVGGPLWSGGVVSGVVPVTFTASDPIGIQDQSVRGDDGRTLVSAPQNCDFSLAQPCPQQPSGSLSVDTRRLADGPHSFSLLVSDAAGNTQVVTSPTVVVDNYGPPAPGALTATAKGGGSNVIALAWRNPVNAPAPVTAAQVQLCQETCPAAITVGSSGAAQVTAPGPGLYTVRLWLLDSHGRGGPHNAVLATVTVPPPEPGVPGAVKTKVTAKLDGRRLRVSGTIARSGRVRVSWRSKVGGRTVGRGSRLVSIRDHRITATFSPPARARRGTIRIAVRVGTRIVAQARARRT